MKKLFSILFIFSITSGVIHAYDFSAVTSSGHTLYYNIVADGVEVTYPYNYSEYHQGNVWYGFTRPVGMLVIDSTVTYNSMVYSVITIANSAFKGCVGLNTVSIPNTVTAIGGGAFSGCNGLTSVSIPNSVTTVGSGAFYGCSGLTSVIIPYMLTSIRSSTFEGCSGLTTITIPNTVTIIGDCAFNGCTNLINVTIPNNVTSIGLEAFMGCSGLTSIVIPSSVTSLDALAFANCTGLSSLILGSGLISIGAGAFGGCTNIASIQIRCYPPSISSNTFNAVPVNIPVTVPCGLMSNYQNAPNWSNFTHYVEGCVTITTMTSDATKGIAIGGGSYSIGDTVTLEAIPFDNAHFIRWSNNSTDNPISFTAQQNATYVAIFGAGSSSNDTVYIHDTTIINNYIHDTTLITLHDTAYINNYIHDTTWVTVHVHDTTIVNNYIHDTTLITLHDTTYINNYIHDTTWITMHVHDTTIVNNYIHDTTYITLHDTITNTVHDTIDNYVYDTMWVHDTTIVTDTLWLTDTVFLYDTIIVYDTVYIAGVENAEPLNAKIYARDGQIMVEGANGYTITLYDAVGRLLATRETLPSGEPCELGVAATGVYLVKVGPYPARRIVVKR